MLGYNNNDHICFEVQQSKDVLLGDLINKLKGWETELQYKIVEHILAVSR